MPPKHGQSQLISPVSGLKAAWEASSSGSSLDTVALGAAESAFFSKVEAGPADDDADESVEAMSESESDDFGGCVLSPFW